MDDGIAGGMEIEEVVLDARGPFAAEDNALQKNSNWFETREESKRRVATFGKVFSVFDKIIRRARSAELALYPGKPKGLLKEVPQSMKMMMMMMSSTQPICHPALQPLFRRLRNHILVGLVESEIIPRGHAQTPPLRLS